jgi:hypothetical protein
MKIGSPPWVYYVRWGTALAKMPLMSLRKDLHDIRGGRDWRDRKRTVELGHEVYALWLLAANGETTLPFGVDQRLNEQRQEVFNRVRASQSPVSNQRADAEAKLKAAEEAADRHAALVAYKLVDELTERIEGMGMEINLADRERSLYLELLHHVRALRKAHGLPLEGDRVTGR